MSVFIDPDVSDCIRHIQHVHSSDYTPTWAQRKRTVQSGGTTVFNGGLPHSKCKAQATANSQYSFCVIFLRVGETGAEWDKGQAG